MVTLEEFMGRLQKIEHYYQLIQREEQKRNDAIHKEDRISFINHRKAISLKLDLDYGIIPFISADLLETMENTALTIHYKDNRP